LKQIDLAIVVVALHQNIFLTGWRRFALHPTQELIGREVILKDLDLDQIINFEHKLVGNYMRFREVESAQRPFRVTRKKI
jgi:hypothetical protein